jgi:hypothetical protein
MPSQLMVNLNNKNEILTFIGFKNREFVAIVKTYPNKMPFCHYISDGTAFELSALMIIKN